MSDDQIPKAFPDVSFKLAAPTKQSLFQRQKAEAEAKKAREAAETQAVFQEFVESFQGDGTSESEPSSGFGATRGGNVSHLSVFGGGGGPPKRHFPPSASRGVKSGPGTLNSDSYPSSRKRAFDGSTKSNDSGRDRSLFAFEDASSPKPIEAKDTFQQSDEDEEVGDDSKATERITSKPTLQLLSVPPGTSSAVIRSLLPTNLTVEGVRIQPPSGPGNTETTERKSINVIVTLAHDTPASNIDNAVNSLQRRYLGWGYYLNISRHLSSTVLNSGISSAVGIQFGSTSLPFGAKAVPTSSSLSRNRAPPPEAGRGFAPPPSDYTPTAATATSRGRPPLAQVNVKPPSDIREAKLIHQTIESLIKYGPKFEAILLNRPEVQREEKWAWIWDPRSAGGVWYRYRLWEMNQGLHHSSARYNPNAPLPLHQLFKTAPPWTEAQDNFPFEFTNEFDEVVSESEYDSSDEDESEDEGAPRVRRRRAYDPTQPEDIVHLLDDPIEETYLDPVQKAKLIHLLSRLPASSGKLRRGDVARITAFAISHSSRGAAEIVDLLVSNVKRPLCFSPRAKVTVDYSDSELSGDEANDYPGAVQTSDDQSASSLITLYLISDVLSASSTSGVRHAWRFRTLFENAITRHCIFLWLGRLDRLNNWGRMRAEKWRRSIKSVLDQWEGWSVFPGAVQDRFVEEFGHGSSSEEIVESMTETKGFKGKGAGWRSLSEGGTTAQDDLQAPSSEDGIDGDPLGKDEVDGEPVGDSDIEGQPIMDEDDVVGASFADDDDIDVDDMVIEESASAPTATLETTTAQPLTNQPAADGNKLLTPRKPRPKAVDMFADSDDDDG